MRFVYKRKGRKKGGYTYGKYSSGRRKKVFSGRRKVIKSFLKGKRY